MTEYSICSFNVNSINTRLTHILEWLDGHPVDILLLQEIKCVNENFPAEAFEERGYNLAIHGQKSYNGVAIISKFPLSDIVTNLDGNEEEGQARYIEAIASLPGAAVRVASAYIPNGQEVGSDKFAYKMRFYDGLYRHWQTRLGYEEPAILGGDFNCALEPIDVYDAKKLEGTVCYHPLEREKLRSLLYLGFTDSLRALSPAARQFSWWDYRAGAYQRGHGLRIDYLLTNPLATDKLLSCAVDETPRKTEKPSDHAPVVARLAA